MITDWATVAEPVPDLTFVNPCYASDIQILNDGSGIVMVTPDNLNMFRVYLDFDGAITSEFVAPFSGVIQDTFPLAFGELHPVFGQVEKDLLILLAGSGILFPGGPVSTSPRIFYRMRIDDDGTPGSEPVSPGYWLRIPEVNIPQALDVDKNWVFKQDIVMVTPGIGLVMPLRGTGLTRRIRIDFDGALISE